MHTFESLSQQPQIPATTHYMFYNHDHCLLIGDNLVEVIEKIWKNINNCRSKGCKCYATSLLDDESDKLAERLVASWVGMNQRSVRPWNSKLAIIIRKMVGAKEQKIKFLPAAVWLVPILQDPWRQSFGHQSEYSSYKPETWTKQKECMAMNFSTNIPGTNFDVRCRLISFIRFRLQCL
jgi:hypothetical protein